MNNIDIMELSKHCTETDCWIMIDGTVYDVTKFIPLHPGMAKPILKCAGADCSKIFHGRHTDDILEKLQTYKITNVCIDHLHK